MTKFVFTLLFLYPFSHKMNLASPPLISKIIKLENSIEANEKIKSLIKKPKDMSENFWLQFMYAKLNPNEACEIFQLLGHDSEFILKDLALIRSYKSCNQINDTQLDQILKINPWLEEEIKNLKLVQIVNNKNDTNALDFLKKNSKFILTNNQNLFYLSQLLNVSLDNQNIELKNLIESSIYHINPLLKTDPTTEEKLKIITYLKNHRKFEEAKEIIFEITNNQNSLVQYKISALKELVKIYKLLGQKNDLLKIQSEIIDLTQKEILIKRSTASIKNVIIETKISQARSVWNYNKPDDALKILFQLKPYTQNILTLMSSIYEEKKNYSLAKEYLLKAMHENKNEISSENLKWNYFWIMYKNNEFENSIYVINELIDKFKDSKEYNKYLFWKSQSLLKSNHKEDATQLLIELKTKDLFGFYGYLAHFKLNIPIAELKINRPTTDIYEQNSHYLKYKWLISLNELQLAQKLTGYLDSDFNFLNEYIPELSDNYEVFDFLSLFKKISLQNEDFKNKTIAKYPSVIFPKPFKKIVKENSKEYQIPEEIIYSIMRQESAFNQYARSPADAFGIMQLTIDSVATIENSLDKNNYEQLYNPQFNIKMGSKYFKYLLKHFDNKMIFAISSYNSNIKATENWMNTRLLNAPEEFIENVPYEETRNYLKYVIRNYINYLRINNPKGFVYPKEILEM